ncbi:DUF4834 family protein [Aequorivita sp. KMM 9714]|nr:DUF4834 family protein [Aequorivita sp. KMM 9714]
MSFLKTILIVLLIYFGLKFLFRLATPYLMRYISKKANQKFEEFFNTNPTAASHQQREGDISIDKMPSRNSRTTNKVGEYVDYEEVE